MTYINQYIEQNHRTVTNITATFHENDGWGTTPLWDIVASFDRTEYTMHDPQYWVIGYEVVILAENGNIYYQQALSVM